MRFYALMQRVGWPRSYRGKILAICFLGTHVPLIALIAWLLSRGNVTDDLGIVLVVLVATLVGTAGALLGLAAMLAPISRATGALNAYAERRQRPDLPSNYCDSAGRLMASVQTTIMQLERSLESLENLSVTDPLTGLYNRRWLDERGERAVSDAHRDRRHFSLLVIDVDRFKTFNDEHGHAVGDQVLILVADAIREGMRGGGYGVRLGGDEFCVLLPDADREQAEATARRIRLATELGVENFIAAGSGAVTLSIGLATQGAEDRSFDGLFARADEQLLTAKRKGRNRVSTR